MLLVLGSSGRCEPRRGRPSLNLRLTNRVPCVLVLFVDTPADIDDMAMLAEFAKLAMARAKAASARAEAIEAEGGDPSAHLVALDRMGRAMRLALSLRRRFADEAQREAGRRVQARKDQLKAALAPAIRLHADFSDRQDLDWALAHRLETEAETFASLPFEAGVARLTRMLGLPDDFSKPAEDPPAEDVHAAPDGAPKADVADPISTDLVARALAVAARATGPP
jgi:hypothetical protein